MKIGILTFHEAENYGAVLQAYALKETIKAIEPDVEILDYKQQYIIKKSIDKKNIGNIIKSILANVVYALPNFIKKHKFYTFRKKYMDISKKVFYNSSQISGKDVYIVGSDQIWNSRITNFDKTFFLDFCKKGDRKIAYAASIGQDNITDFERSFIKDNINNIQYISVRESVALPILQKLTNKEVVNVLDPTLLADLRIWDYIAGKNKNCEDYLLVYKLTSNEEVFKIAKIIAQKTGLKVLHISDSLKKDMYGFERARGIGPLEFVSLFKNASFVVTDSFHGTAFSIIFNKDFITVPHETRASRMICLLNLLELRHRLVVSSDELIEGYIIKVDYEAPNKILAKEKKKSFDFLLKSIKG